jgi:hypothetical protein
MRKIILLCVLMAIQVFASPLFAQMVAPILELPAANDTAVSTSPLLQTSNHGDARIEFEVDSVSTFNSPGKQVTVSFPNKWGDKEQGRVQFLKFNKKYYWRGRSAMDGDTSPWSSARSFRTTTKPILQYPANNSTDGLSAFGWKDAGSLTYTVQLDTTEDFSSPFAQTIDVKDTAFPKYGTIFAYAPKLLYGKKHYWRVIAFHENDTSEWTAVWNFTLPTKPTLKSPATNSTNWPDYATIEWNTLWDAQFYQVEYDTTEDFSSVAKRDTILVKTYKVTLKDLYFGSKHYWRVRAIYAGDTSLWSETWNFSTEKKAKLSSPYNNNNIVELNEYLRWTSFSSGPSKRLYELQADTSADFYSPKLFTKFTNSSAETLPDKTFSTTYFWRVRIINLNDTSDWTDTWKFTTRARNNAQNLYPYDKTVNAGTSLEFTVVNRIEGYYTVYEIDTTTNFNSPLLIKDTLQHLTTDAYPDKTIGGFHYGKKYYWRGKVFNHADSTNWSLPYTFTTVAKPTLDFPPNNYPNYSTETNLVAKPLEGADYYIMELDTTPNFNSPAFRTDTSSETTINSGYELYFNKWYYWHFRAVNKYDTSDWSDTWRFQSTTTVFLFKPANKSYNNSNKPHIDFGGIGGATGYQYLLSKDSTFKDVKPISVFGQANTDFDVYAGYGATFYWKVRAFHAKDTSPWSATWIFTTKNAPVLPAPTLTYPKNNNTTVQPGKVTFTWNSNGINAFSYDFQLSYSDDFSSAIIDTKVPNAFAVVNSMKPEQQYFWRVRTYYDTLISPWSSTSKFTTLQNTGIEENTTGTDLVKIFPNPATQTLYIQAAKNALLQAYTLMDVNGRILYQNAELGNKTEEKIDISQLKPGLYILNITSDKGNIYRRVIKQ